MMVQQFACHEKGQSPSISKVILGCQQGCHNHLEGPWNKIRVFMLKNTMERRPISKYSSWIYQLINWYLKMDGGSGISIQKNAVWGSAEKDHVQERKPKFQKCPAGSDMYQDRFWKIFKKRDLCASREIRYEAFCHSVKPVRCRPTTLTWRQFCPDFCAAGRAKSGCLYRRRRLDSCSLVKQCCSSLTRPVWAGEIAFRLGLNCEDGISWTEDMILSRFLMLWKMPLIDLVDAQEKLRHGRTGFCTEVLNFWKRMERYVLGEDLGMEIIKCFLLV